MESLNQAVDAHKKHRNKKDKKNHNSHEKGNNPKVFFEIFVSDAKFNIFRPSHLLQVVGSLEWDKEHQK